MGLSEFDLIDRFFRGIGRTRSDVVLGVGDDGAILRGPPGHELVMVSDTLVAGVHFPLDSPARSVGHRALAVNLSDIAAMGATPAWALLSLTLPEVHERWLTEFAGGFSHLARTHDVQLVGGDTTRGPLSLSVQVVGMVPPETALRRSTARPGDLLFVSGRVGEAAGGLALLQATYPPQASLTGSVRRSLIERFEFPQPRLALALQLRGIASAAMDISDGLLADAEKLARASGLRLRIDLERLPLSAALQASFSPEIATKLMLTGGDDYELLFSVSRKYQDRLTQLISQGDITQIGECLPEMPEDPAHAGVELWRDGTRQRLSALGIERSGFDHFA